MSFLPHQSDNGLQPWEYYPAAAGSYKVGQMLKMTGWLNSLDEVSAVTPDYVCMADVTVKNEELLPVLRVTGDMIFETKLAQEDMDACPGRLYKVSADGMTVEGDTGEGCFKTTYVEGIEAGCIVRGRFQ